MIIANQGPGLNINYDPIGLGWRLHQPPGYRLGKISYPKKQKEWFNTTAFAAPIPAWAGGLNQGFGNARKDAVLGPGHTNFNTSFFKTFPIKESAQLQVPLRDVQHLQPYGIPGRRQQLQRNEAGVIRKLRADHQHLWIRACSSWEDELTF